MVVHSRTSGLRRAGLEIYFLIIQKFAVSGSRMKYEYGFKAISSACLVSPREPSHIKKWFGFAVKT
jgi:hypothetical protein